jgi:hypothetical protein
MKAKSLIPTVKLFNKKNAEDKENEENDFNFQSWKSDAEQHSVSSLNISKEKFIKRIFKTSKIKPKNIIPDAIQCNGTAKRTGFPCKNFTKNKNGYCHHHN